MQNTALFTLHDTSRASEMAWALIKAGWKIIATSETSSILTSKSIPVVDIKEFVSFAEEYGFPPTLHPKMEAVLTKENLSEKIDLVFVINYPLSEGNDVGGYALLLLAVKGNRVPVTNYEDMERVIKDIAVNQKISEGLRKELQEKALLKTIRHNIDLLSLSGSRLSFLGLKKEEQLLFGENPYQSPAYFCADLQTEKSGYALGDFKRLAGETPCYTNLADADHLLHTMYVISKAFHKYHGKIPYISIAAKHGNPCGLAVDWSCPEDTIERALRGNPVAIWGGEFICNFVIKGSSAGLLFESTFREKITGNRKWMLDVIMTPGMDDEAALLLGKRKRTKLYVNDSLRHPHSAPEFNLIKSVKGGFLTQPANNYILDFNRIKWINGPFDKKFIDSYIVAFATAFTSFHGGNEVAIVKDNQLLSVGGGPSTVESAKIAVWRAGNNQHDSKGSVFVADAFFPFPDAPQVLINAGCISGLVPAGGRNHDKIVELFTSHKIAIGFIPEEYSGFCRH
jgi:phosphoribosylaminoimidazolecarboxamide formyltransferase/IMP cyclohydrolase